MMQDAAAFAAQALEPPLAAQAADFRPYAQELRALAPSWRQHAVFARLCPDGVALHSRHGSRTYAQLHAHADALAQGLHDRGLRRGDAVALQCTNRPEFVEVLLAAMRLGLRLTPLSTQLNAAESHYIVNDCEAKLFFAEPGLGGAALSEVERIDIGSPAYLALLALAPRDAVLEGGGNLMLYTSGTTGRPKGVRRVRAEYFEPQYQGSLCDYRPGDVQVCAGPAYHAAPLLIDLRWPLLSGVPVLLIDKWDSHNVLVALATHRVSCGHFVPTMLRRLLELPLAERQAHDLSALRLVIHGAAPCPVELKHALIEWLGPVLWEYYGATEGGEGISVNSQDWLRRPGTVGRLDPAFGHRVIDELGNTVPARQVGRVWLNISRDTHFSYHQDEAKNHSSFQHGGLVLGDMGYCDEEGWLFLTGRSAETIISGGVNIYPVEIDHVLRTCPGVADVACVGAPDAQWGERVVAVVVPAEPQADLTRLTARLSAHAEQHLAAFKRPRSYDFTTTLPYTATGKLLRGSLRATYWPKDGPQI